MTELFVLARIAGRDVAIPSEQVESVVDIGVITPVPRAAAVVRGLAALRSRVVTVIDTAVSLGRAATSPGVGRAVIVRRDGHDYALLVDALEDIEPLTLLPLANGVALDPIWRGIALGIVERDGEPVLAIDLAALLATPVTQAA